MQTNAVNPISRLFIAKFHDYSTNEQSLRLNALNINSLLYFASLRKSLVVGLSGRWQDRTSLVEPLSWWWRTRPECSQSVASTWVNSVWTSHSLMTSRKPLRSGMISVCFC